MKSTYKITKTEFMRLYGLSTFESLGKFMAEALVDLHCIIPEIFIVKFENNKATFHDEKDNIFADYSSFPKESLHFQAVLSLYTKSEKYENSTFYGCPGAQDCIYYFGDPSYRGSPNIHNNREYSLGDR